MNVRMLACLCLNVLFWVAVALAIFLHLYGDVQAAGPPVEPCIPIGSAEGQQLYLCENDYAPDCVWDPSPGLGAGVVDCDW